MKYEIVSIKDRALDAYMRPFFTPTIGAAVRSFQDEINNPQGEMHKHPDDYDLFHLGSWHDNTGEFKNLGTPALVAIGKQMLKTAN